jgi:hypothetical protein
MRHLFVLRHSSARILFRSLLVGLLAVGVVASVRPCTTFYLVDNTSFIFGRNYDYYASDGRVMINRRGLQKTAFGTNSGLQWVSRFGSLTFNQWATSFRTVASTRPVWWWK